MITWQAGDRALCIRDDWDFPALGSYMPSGVPRRGTVYLVERVEQHPGNQVLYLAGLKVYYMGYEAGWNALDFRRVVPQCDRPRTMRMEEFQSYEQWLERIMRPRDPILDADLDEEDDHA